MSENTRILFVGETWRGSSARSLRDGLERIDGIWLDEVGEDHYFPKARSRVLRGAVRLLRPMLRTELEQEVISKLDVLRPDVMMVYKGSGITAQLVRHAKSMGVFVVDVFPDASPLLHGPNLREAMGEYDLVISTKPFHPPIWKTIYGYSNDCVCVPHGYDPAVHYWADAPGAQEFDVVLAASWRPQYEKLMMAFGALLPEPSLRVGLAGPGWSARSALFPAHWVCAGSLIGRAYGDWLRRGKIAIAPVNSEVVIAGRSHPGDEDTTRSYELAAAGCFFVHRRTPYIQTVYDEKTEVPMWDDPIELAALVSKYLPRAAERRAMAAAAHMRAVPAYSIPSRAKQVLEHTLRAIKTCKRSTQ